MKFQCLKLLLILNDLDYVNSLFEEVITFIETGQIVPVTSAPSALCSSFEHPDKDEAVMSHVSRFNRLFFNIFKKIRHNYFFYKEVLYILY